MSFITTKINDRLYEFTELADLQNNGQQVPYVDAYLLMGETRAALINALQYSEGLYAEIRKYTSLPLDVFITHGHGDHAGQSLTEFAREGCAIYMDMKDFDRLTEMSPFAQREWFTDIKNGDTFDLGGLCLQALACGGHTPGCMVFLERGQQYLFSGDTIGSGSFWMQIPGCLPIRQFQKNVAALLQQVADLDHLLVYPGHRNQSPVQLTLDYVRDCLFITNGLVAGTVKGVHKVLDMPGRHMEFKTAAHGQMLDFCYDPENI